MKKIILNIGIILIMIILLFFLTGCKENEENEENNINNLTNSNISVEENNTNIINNNISNQQNNEISISNDIEQADSKNETSISKNDNEQVNKENETTENTQKKTTFNVGDYVLHYGKYKGSGTKLIDTSVVSSSITINLKADGTYTYVSTNQEVSRNRSGTYKIKSNNVIVLNDSEPLEYTVLGDDRFIERQSSGFTFYYQEN